ncbi:MAG: hypothetical protein H7X80_08890, partial [bacterium]|nr:hypothetical protein [Candidatus Kapabacteria bacterium]
MNEHTMNIDDLISQYIDGELAGEAEAELHHRLSVAPDDRKRFREQIMLRGIARDRQLLSHPTPAMRTALFARLTQEEGLTAAAATSVALARDRGTSELSTPAASARAESTTAGLAGAASTGAASTRASSTSSPSLSRAGDRTAMPRDERRRRRLIPMLLPFVIGVIMTGLIWQFNDDDSPSSSKHAITAVEPSAKQGGKAGPMSVDENIANDGGGLTDQSTNGAPRLEETATDAGAGGVAADGSSSTREKSLMAAGPESVRSASERESYVREPAAPRGRADRSGGSSGYRGREGASSSSDVESRSDSRTESLSESRSESRTESRTSSRRGIGGSLSSDFGEASSRGEELAIADAPLGNGGGVERNASNASDADANSSGARGEDESDSKTKSDGADGGVKD